MMHGILLLTTFLSILFPCSAFFHSGPGSLVLGANTDACDPVEGLIIVNKRNVQKRGSEAGTTGKSAQWVSAYGSVTFTYCCREIAQYGMNEAGLVIATVGLPGSESAPADDRPPLDGNIWAQYLLDTCGSVEDAIRAQSGIRLVNDKDQYLMADSTGSVAVFECLNGQLKIIKDNELEESVLTNEVYLTCLTNWKSDRIPGRDPYISNQRFQAGVQELKRISSQPLETLGAFKILDHMSQHPCTQWNLVFSIDSRTIRFRTRSQPGIKSIRLSGIDFTCQTPMLQMNVHDPSTGDVTGKFEVYSSEVNLKYLDQAFTRFGIQRTAEEKAGILEFFDSFSCKP